MQPMAVGKRKNIKSDFMKILLIESQYFPSLEYYLTLLRYDKLKIERYEHYQKVTYRNRCYVAGPNGRILLSVPLERGKNQRTPMKEVRICNGERWQALHWKTLESAYRRSPWFEYFEDELAPCFGRRYHFLLDWNLEMFDRINRLLDLDITYELTDSFRLTYEEPGLTDARDRILPGAWRQEDTAGDYPVYTQVFGERTGFLPNLSILDLLFCEGKNAKEILEAAR